ncbi:MAG TPA: hypothetical protein VFK47_06680, partial [Ktedonobacteraceae bacterium]|nr:hypothetical protein [Ktedonobacteraceae bacterium]
MVNGVKSTDRVQIGMQAGNTAAGPQYDTVGNVIKSFNTWSQDATQFQKFRLQAYQAGLIPSKNASKAEVLVAWQTVVEEASKDKMDPQTLIEKAVNSGGWNKMQPSIMPSDNGLSGTGNANSVPDQTNSQTTYVSYLDPATIQGAQADAWFRLMGRNPSSEEYQNFLQAVYGYQGEENTGKFEATQKSAALGPDGTPG